MADLVDRALSNLNQANADYYSRLKREEDTKAQTEAPAFVTGFANGKYQVERLGQDPVAVGVSVTNGLLETGRRTTTTGQFVDGVPRVKPVVTTTPIVSTGKIKYLYSIIKDGIKEFYVAGWRLGKTVKVTPSLPNVSQVISAAVDNLGGDRFSVNFAYRCTGDSDQTLHIEKTGSSGLVWRVTISLSQASSSFSPTITGSPVTEQPPTHVSHGFWYQPAARTVIEIHNIFDETGLLYSYFAAIETVKHNVFDGMINSAVQPAGVQGVFHPEITPNTLHTPVVRLPSTNFATPVSDDRTFTFASTGSFNLPFINLAIDVSGNYGLGLDRITSALRWSTLTGYTESTAAYTAIVVAAGTGIWYDATKTGFSTILQSPTITDPDALTQNLKNFQIQTYNADFSPASTVKTTVYKQPNSGYTLYNASYHA